MLLWAACVMRSSRPESWRDEQTSEVLLSWVDTCRGCGDRDHEFLSSEHDLWRGCSGIYISHVLWHNHYLFYGRFAVPNREGDRAQEGYGQAG